MIYSCGVLVYNRRMTKKYVAAEACRTVEEGNLAHVDDIPFGVRALETGVRVEGIWFSRDSTPLPSPPHPGTPASSRSASPGHSPRSSSYSTLAETRLERSRISALSTSRLPIKRDQCPPRLTQYNAADDDDIPDLDLDTLDKARTEDTDKGEQEQMPSVSSSNRAISEDVVEAHDLRTLGGSRGHVPDMSK